MSSQQEDIRTLERAILQEASSEAQRVLADARMRVTSMRQEAQAQLDAETAALVAQARDEAEGLLEHTTAEVRVDAQSLRLQRRERLLNHVFADAQQRLAETPQRPDYAEIARFLVQEGVREIEADRLIIRADAQTARFLNPSVLSSLGQELGVELEMGTPLPEGTGVMLQTPDGHRRFDNTLENRLTRLRDRLRAPVFSILMGEST